MPISRATCRDCDDDIGIEGDVCINCIAEADDGDQVAEFKTKKRRASRPPDTTVLVPEAPTLKREASPNIKRESVEPKLEVSKSILEEAEVEEEISYVSSRPIRNRPVNKRARRKGAYDGESVKVETDS